MFRPQNGTAVPKGSRNEGRKYGVSCVGVTTWVVSWCEDKARQIPMPLDICELTEIHGTARDCCWRELDQKPGRHEDNPRRVRKPAGKCTRSESMAAVDVIRCPREEASLIPDYVRVKATTKCYVLRYNGVGICRENRNPR